MVCDKENRLIVRDILEADRCDADAADLVDDAESPLHNLQHGPGGGILAEEADDAHDSQKRNRHDAVKHDKNHSDNSSDHDSVLSFPIDTLIIRPAHFICKKPLNFGNKVHILEICSDCIQKTWLIQYVHIRSGRRASDAARPEVNAIRHVLPWVRKMDCCSSTVIRMIGVLLSEIPICQSLRLVSSSLG